MRERYQIPMVWTTGVMLDKSMLWEGVPRPLEGIERYACTRSQQAVAVGDLPGPPGAVKDVEQAEVEAGLIAGEMHRLVNAPEGVDPIEVRHGRATPPACRL